MDVVVIAGDLLDIRSAAPLPAQAAAITAQVGRIGQRTTVLAASGNHDLDERDGTDEKTATWRPSHVLLDLDAGQATWLSATERESVSL